jgi:membrane protein DedA with SNARE-associated domain
LQPLLDWLIALPAVALYFIVAAAAFIENIVPPLPSDLVIAFGSFLAAQRGSGLAEVFAATWAGNIAGAVLVFWLGRRYGAARLERRLAGRHAEAANERMRRLMDRWGLAGIFFSRFIPGVRAIVPAFAGALRLPFVRTAVIMASASGIWYAIVTIMAYRVGADWDALRATLKHYGTALAVIATAIVIVGVLFWMVRRRRVSARPPA